MCTCISDRELLIPQVYAHNSSIGNSTDLLYKVNMGSYELPLFKPPLCKVADAESDVRAIVCVSVCMCAYYYYIRMCL